MNSADTSSTTNQAINQAIRDRRTIKPKFFSDRHVDESIIDEMIENACWAPTHGMTQPWRFRVFVGNARQRLADFLAETYKAITPADAFKPNKYEGMQKNATLASAVIAIGMKRQEIKKITELDEIMAVACAVQNMHLTASAHRVGGFWSTNVAAVSQEMCQFIGLGDDDRALGLFYVGYPANEWPDSQREPTADKVQWLRE